MGGTGLEGDKKGGGSDMMLSSPAPVSAGPAADAGPGTTASSYVSPAAGLGSADMMLGPQGHGDIPQSGGVAQLTPDMLSPKVKPNTTPDETLDPAWFAADQKKKTGVDAKGIQDILRGLAFAHGGSVRAPTEAQKEAGNYRKGHIRFNGLDISIETPKGHARTGKDPGGKKWSVTMPADYGYVKGTEGADGDHVDVFVGPHRDSHSVFIINQHHHDTGKFDEHKVMLGYQSEKEACADYCRAFSDGKGPQRCKSVETVSLDAFKKWLNSGKTKTAAKGKTIVDHAIRHIIGRQARG